MSKQFSFEEKKWGIELWLSTHCIWCNLPEDTLTATSHERTIMMYGQARGITSRELLNKSIIKASKNWDDFTTWVIDIFKTQSDFNQQVAPQKQASK